MPPVPTGSAGPRRPVLLAVFAGILVWGILRFPFSRAGERRAWFDATLTPSIILKAGLPDRAGYFALLGGLPHCGEECGGVLLRVPHRMDIDFVVRVGGVGRKVDRDVGFR